MKSEFIVYGVPVGKGRPRFTRTGHPYTPDKTKEYEDSVRRSWKGQSGMTFPDRMPLHLSLTAYFPVPKSTSKRRAALMEGKFHLGRPDSDNIAKSVMDALNGYAYLDDSVIQVDRAWKIYTNGAPRVEVVITGEEEYCGK